MMRLTKTLIFCAFLMALCIPLSAQDNGPTQIVSAFLNAWSAKDSAAMWGTLSRTSQEAYPQQVFANRYTVANEAMGFESLTFTIKDTKLQGLTAAVNYDIVISSGMFGEIADPNRTMRVYSENGRWGVAWSSMDIFAELPSVGTLTSAGQLSPRANIYDRNGNIVAGSGAVVTMYTARGFMSNENDCKSVLARVLRRPYAAFDQLFSLYITLDAIFYVGEMNETDYNANQEALTNICGIGPRVRQGSRTYYGNNTMSHATGYVGQITAEQQADYVARGYSVGDLIGQGGVERMFERDLAGTPDRVLRITEPGGTILRQFASTGGTAPLPVQMTIDRDLQVAVATAMEDAYDYAYGNWGNPVISSEGAAIVLDVKTGEILALVSYPLFDPLLFDPTSPDAAGRLRLLTQVISDVRRPLINHGIQDRYTPGSTYKLVTAAAVMNEGIIAPGEIFNCEYVWSGREYGDDRDTRTDWRNDEDRTEFPPAGPITPAQAIMASCNPFFYQYGAVLFRQYGNKLAEYGRMMGLGAPYNIFGGTVEEAEAILDNPAYASEAISIAVGQRNVTVPPIQMAVLVAAIANGGTVYKPTLIKQVGGMDGTPIKQTYQPEILNTLNFEDGVMEEIQEGMCGATSDEFYGTAFIRFETATYTSCGKTGTAQTAGNANAWYVAYAPAEDPEIAVVVLASQSLHGAQVSAPITRRILDYYFSAEVEPYPPWWMSEPFSPLVIPLGSTGG